MILRYRSSESILAHVLFTLSAIVPILNMRNGGISKPSDYSELIE